MRRSNLPIKPEQSGMALLLVISVISLLTVVIMEFNQSMRYAMVDFSSYQERTQITSMTQSGVDMACALLHADRRQGDHDTLIEDWARLSDQAMSGLFPHGELKLSVIDLSGRFPINSVVATASPGKSDGLEGARATQAREILVRLLSNGKFVVDSEEQAREIVDCLVDWIDSDDEESPYGVESSYYETLGKPYQTRNGAVQSVEELLLVKGITRELLYGNKEKTGLVDFINVYGTNAKININTVPLDLFMALDDRISEENIQHADEFRRQPENSDLLIDTSWYRQVGGWPGDVVIDDKMLTTKSDSFLIDSSAVLNEQRGSVAVVVERPDENQMEILYVKRQ